jgi:hypothetical protein
VPKGEGEASRLARDNGLAESNVIVSGYSLHLYCSCAECKATPYKMARSEFAEPKERQAFRAAKQAGWRIERKTGRCWARGHVKRSTDTAEL